MHTAPRSELRWPLAGLAMLLAGVALWCFGAPFDLGLFDLLLLDQEPRWAALMRGLTTLGGFAVLGPLLLLIVVALFATRRRRPAIWLLATVMSGRIAIDLLKMITDRPRPPLDDRLTEVSSMSFPSAHAGNSLLTLLALLIVFPAVRRWMFPIGAALILAIGWSRIGLGVHWPSDILAGWGLALFWVAIAMRWMPSAGRPSQACEN